MSRVDPTPTRAKQLKDSKKGQKQGIRFTFFAVEGNYPLSTLFEHAFYSVNYLQKQVWRDVEPRNAFKDGLGAKYRGWVPFEVLYTKLNDLLVGEKYDLRKVYKNYRIRYEQGTFGPDIGPDGKPVTRLNDSKTVEESKGNPPPNRENQAW